MSNLTRGANPPSYCLPPHQRLRVPNSQVRVVRFYVNSRSFSSFFSSSSSPDLNYDDHSRVFAAGPQPRPATPSVCCRTSTTTSHAQCSLPDLNHDHKRPVFAAGPQLLCQKICQIECQKICHIECQKI